MTVRYKGTMKICLWFREHPSLGQETGPPVPNYYIEAYGGTQVLGDGYTDENGCVSIPFESSWPGSSLSVGFRFHNGSGSRQIYPSDLYQMIDWGDMSIDWLPENHFRAEYDCSKCESFYADSDFPSTSPGRLTPSGQHSCASNNWGFDCCGYDWNTKRCGVQQFFPEFQFLHECGGCPKLQYDAPSGDEKEKYEAPPPVDCSVCDQYYPDDSMETPTGDRGELSPLTRHACTNEDEIASGRYGSSCCAYDFKTEQCGLLEIDTSYTYLHEGNRQFLYPCGGTCKIENGGFGALGIGIVASVVAFLLVSILFYLYRRRRYTPNSCDNRNSEGGLEQQESTNKMKPNQSIMNVPSSVIPIPPPMPSAPPMEKEIEVVVATPILDNNLVFVEPVGAQP